MPIREYESNFPLADLALARRLERAEALANARFVEARARLFPDLGAGWIDVAGAYAMFDGPDSPLTQTFGLGLFDPAGETELESIEAFFANRGAPTFHEVSPLTDESLTTLLADRGYRPLEVTSVLYRPIDRDITVAGSRNERIRVRTLRPGEEEMWSRTSAGGWDEHPELTGFLMEIGRVSTAAEGSVPFLAEIDGRPVATGMLHLGDGVALLAGASTLPEARRQGAQRTLLESRLRHAAAAGCDIAMMGARPGSSSQRNAERQGFRIAYTRIKWVRPGIGKMAEESAGERG
jgi:GNAT superfamily N-acetyltransferase